MYEYNVGIIAEGPTDVEVIEGILRTVFAKDTFCFRTISPTPQELQSQRKKEGFGWGGVYRVCKDLREKLEMLTLMGRHLIFWSSTLMETSPIKIMRILKNSHCKTICHVLL